MNNQLLSKIMDEYFETNPPPYFSFDYGKLIPLRKLKNARKRYAYANVNKIVDHVMKKK